MDLSACHHLAEILPLAFKNCKSIKEVTLPASIKTIGEQGFVYCTKLRKVDMSECHQLKEIGLNVFCGCELLAEVSLPDSVKTIGEQAFCKCSKLKKIDMSACHHLTEIEKNAFTYCDSLAEVILPDSLEYFGLDAFRCGNIKTFDMFNCHKLKSFDFVDVGINQSDKLRSLVLPSGMEEVHVSLLKMELYLPPTLKNLQIDDLGWGSIYCYSSDLESIDIDIDDDDDDDEEDTDEPNVIYVLPQYQQHYKDKLQAAGINLEVKVIPDDKLYVYDE